MTGNVAFKYYAEEIDLNNVEALKLKLKALVEADIGSVTDLEAWLQQESTLSAQIQEAMSGHQIDFYRDTANAEKREIHLHDQSVVRPIVLQYRAMLDKKFCDCPFTEELDDARFGWMKQVRRTRVSLHRDENIALSVRQKELAAKYTEIMGGLSVAWDGEAKSVPVIKALLDHRDRTIRERAWRALADARRSVKPAIDEIMNEFVQLRHQMAVNAGFDNYRDYMLIAKYREYTVEDCADFHAAVERHIVPAWKRLADVFQAELGVDTYRPWDSDMKILKGAPFTTVTELMDGVEAMLERTDADFANLFRFMRKNGLLDLESRQGKRSGGFMEPLLASKNAFVFANFGPSFNAVIALIHEMGHAVNYYLQFEREIHFHLHEENWREEIGELYSHGMEMLLLDKLDVFYPDASEFQRAQREELRRSLGLLLGPLMRDVFEQWMYTHPEHTSADRDAKFLEISQRFRLSPVDCSGVEAEVSASWIDTLHYFVAPFYALEYSISELGAMQLLNLYRTNPERALAWYKRGAGTNMNQPIADVYRETGVAYDFSESTIQNMGGFLEGLMMEQI